MSQRLPLRAQLGFSALWLCSQRTVAISLRPCPRNAARKRSKKSHDDPGRHFSGLFTRITTLQPFITVYTFRLLTRIPPP